MPTNQANSSGRWSDKSIWSLGRIPVAGDDVVIPSMVSVEYDYFYQPPQPGQQGAYLSSLTIDELGALTVTSQGRRPLTLATRLIRLVDGGWINASVKFAPGLQPGLTIYLMPKAGYQSGILVTGLRALQLTGDTSTPPFSKTREHAPAGSSSVVVDMPWPKWALATGAEVLVFPLRALPSAPFSAVIQSVERWGTWWKLHFSQSLPCDVPVGSLLVLNRRSIEIQVDASEVSGSDIIRIEGERSQLYLNGVRLLTTAGTGGSCISTDGIPLGKPSASRLENCVVFNCLSGSPSGSLELVDSTFVTSGPVLSGADGIEAKRCVFWATSGPVISNSSNVTVQSSSILATGLGESEAPIQDSSSVRIEQSSIVSGRAGSGIVPAARLAFGATGLTVCGAEVSCLDSETASRPLFHLCGKVIARSVSPSPGTSGWATASHDVSAQQAILLVPSSTSENHLLSKAAAVSLSQSRRPVLTKAGTASLTPFLVLNRFGVVYRSTPSSLNVANLQPLVHRPFTTTPPPFSVSGFSCTSQPAALQVFLVDSGRSTDPYSLTVSFGHGVFAPSSDGLRTLYGFSMANLSAKPLSATRKVVSGLSMPELFPFCSQVVPSPSAALEVYEDTDVETGWVDVPEVLPGSVMLASQQAVLARAVSASRRAHRHSGGVLDAPPVSSWKNTSLTPDRVSPRWERAFVWPNTYVRYVESGGRLVPQIQKRSPGGVPIVTAKNERVLVSGLLHLPPHTAWMYPKLYVGVVTYGTYVGDIAWSADRKQIDCSLQVYWTYGPRVRESGTRWAEWAEGVQLVPTELWHWGTIWFAFDMAPAADVIEIRFICYGESDANYAGAVLLFGFEVIYPVH